MNVIVEDNKNGVVGMNVIVEDNKNGAVTAAGHCRW